MAKPFKTCAVCPKCGRLATGPHHTLGYTNPRRRCGWWWDNSEKGVWRYWRPRR